MITQVGEKTFAVKLSDPDANVFSLIAFAREVLRKEGKRKEAETLAKKVFENAKSYEQAIEIMKEFGIEFIVIE